mgnify:CR=1 FL=1|jgi:hypothetical protein
MYFIYDIYIYYNIIVYERMSNVRFKTFTQAYFLIKNNNSYAKSLGDRAQNIIFWASLTSIWFVNSLKMGLPANDKI